MSEQVGGDLDAAGLLHPSLDPCAVGGLGKGLAISRIQKDVHRRGGSVGASRPLVAFLEPACQVLDEHGAVWGRITIQDVGANRTPVLTMTVLVVHPG